MINFQRHILMVLLLLWILILIIPTASSLTLHSTRGELDVLSKAQEATLSVLRKSWLPSCSIVFITDGSIPSSAIYNILENTEKESNVGVFEVLSWRQDNITVLHQSNMLRHLKQIGESSRCLTLVVAGDEEYFLGDLIESSFSNGLLHWPTRLLVVTRVPHGRLQHLQEIFSVVNVMVIILEETSISKRCGVYMYLPYSLRRVHVASWTPQLGLTYLTNQQLFLPKFSKLTDGANLVVAGVNFPPHIKVQEITTENGETKDSFSGPIMMLLDMLALSINFTYKAIRPHDNSWGVLSSNGTWNGMVGKVLKKEVDFALGPFAITYLRSRVIDYTNPLVVDYGRVLGRRGDSEVDPWSFMMPFTSSVWAAIMVALFVVLAIVMLFSKVGWDSPFSSEISLFSYSRIILSQDINQGSGSWWERLIIGGWMLTILVLMKSYSGNLMSLLAVRYISHPYQTVRDVLDDPSVKMIFFANTAYVQYIQGVKSGIFHEVKEAGERGQIEYITPAVYEETVDTLVSRGDHVMMNPYLIMKMFLTEDFTERGQCKYYVSKERYLPLTFCLVVAKKSPLSAAINEGIRAVTESGLYYYWLDNAIPNTGSCKHPPTKITIKSSLSISNLWGVFVILVGGYSISFLVLSLELARAKLLQVLNRTVP